MTLMSLTRLTPLTIFSGGVLWRRCINAISAKTIITRAVSENARIVKEACTYAFTAVKAVRMLSRSSTVVFALIGEIKED